MDQEKPLDFSMHCQYYQASTSCTINQFSLSKGNTSDSSNVAAVDLCKHMNNNRSVISSPRKSLIPDFLSSRKYHSTFQQNQTDDLSFKLPAKPNNSFMSNSAYLTNVGKNHFEVNSDRTKINPHMAASLSKCIIGPPPAHMNVSRLNLLNNSKLFHDDYHDDYDDNDDNDDNITSVSQLINTTSNNPLNLSRAVLHVVENSVESVGSEVSSIQCVSTNNDLIVADLDEADFKSSFLTLSDISLVISKSVVNHENSDTSVSQRTRSCRTIHHPSSKKTSKRLKQSVTSEVLACVESHPCIEKNSDQQKPKRRSRSSKLKMDTGNYMINLKRNQKEFAAPKIVRRINKEKFTPQVSHCSGEKVYTLKKWLICAIPDIPSVMVEGIQIDEMHTANEYWRSSNIVERIDSCTLKSSSGSIYKLVGTIDGRCSLKEGFSRSFVRSFRIGFPKKWKEIIKNHFERKRHHKIPVSSQTDKTVKSKNKTSKEMNNAKLTKEKEVSIFTDRNLEFWSLPKTKSGRTIKPPLNHWKSERVILNPRTQEVQIVDISGILSSSETPTPKPCRKKSMRRHNSVTNADTLKVMAKKSERKQMTSMSNATSKRSKSRLKSDSENIMINKVNKSNITNQDTMKVTKSDLGKEATETKGKKSMSTTTSKKERSLKNSLSEKSDNETFVTYMIKSPDTSISKRTRGKMKKSFNEDTKILNKTNSSDRSPFLSRNKNKTLNESEFFVPNKFGQKDPLPKTVSKQKNISLECAGLLGSLSQLELQNSLLSDSLFDDESVTSDWMDSYVPKARSDGKKQWLIPRGRSSRAHGSDESISSVVFDERKSVSATCTAGTVLQKNKTNISRKKPSEFVKKNKSHCTVPDKEVASTSFVIDGMSSQWKSEEVECLYSAIKIVPATMPNYWKHVALYVDGKSAEECQRFHYKDAPSTTKKKPRGNCSLTIQQKSLGGRGTMKRKRQIRELLHKNDENYEADLFDSTPFKKLKTYKTEGLVGDLDIPQTPLVGFTPVAERLMPLSAHKTPTFFSPELLKSVSRNDTDRFVHNMLRGKGNRPLKQVHLTKTPCRKASNLQDLPEPNEALFTIVERQPDDESETEDYYWSDYENDH